MGLTIICCGVRGLGSVGSVLRSERAHVRKAVLSGERVRVVTSQAQLSALVEVASSISQGDWSSAHKSGELETRQNEGDLDKSHLCLPHSSNYQS